MYYTITASDYVKAQRYARVVMDGIPARYNRKRIKAYNKALVDIIEDYRTLLPNNPPYSIATRWLRLKPTDLGTGRYFDTFQSVVEESGITRVNDKSVWDSAQHRTARRLMLAIIVPDALGFSNSEEC